MRFYFGAKRYNIKPKTAKIMLGSQTASKVGKPTLTAATVVICMANMYTKTNPNPMAMLTPIPPRFFLEETANPITVST